MHASEDEFVTVTKGHRLCSRRARPTASSQVLTVSRDEKTVAAIDATVCRALNVLTESELWPSALKVVDEQFLSRFHNVLIDVICYGIGNFSTSYIATHQMAFVVGLVQWLADVKSLTSHCVVFDPLLDDNEQRWLSSRGYTAGVNDRGLRTIRESGERATIFFLPHCGRPLFNNVLFANWSPQRLQHVCLVGNSLSLLRERLVREDERDMFDYVVRAERICTEVPMHAYSFASDIFNDMAIHTFNAPVEGAEHERTFWTATCAPDYGGLDSPEIL